MCPNAQASNEIIDRASKTRLFTIEKFDLPIDQHSIKGLIYYPQNWDRADRSRCIVYHHGNGMSVSGFFETGKLDWTPGEIANITHCPIIMYDYRGTGLSSGDPTTSKIRPTYASVVDDGEKVLRFALEKFKDITIIGSSLGGAVATASLARHLTCSKTPSTSPYFIAPGRVRLINHDSFTTSTSVVMPKWPKIASWAGWMVGGFVDAQTPMKTLINQNIPITVLCHQNDPVIPCGARMSELVGSLPPKSNVSVFNSPEYGHANLSSDMLATLRSKLTF